MKRTWHLLAGLILVEVFLSFVLLILLPDSPDIDRANRTTDLTIAFLTGLLAVQLTIWTIAITLLRSGLTSIDKRDIGIILRWMIASATWTCLALLTTVLAPYFIKGHDQIAIGILATALTSTIFIIHLASRKI
jgi:hypothetical protein